MVILWSFVLRTSFSGHLRFARHSIVIQLSFNDAKPMTPQANDAKQMTIHCLPRFRPNCITSITNILLKSNYN